MRLYIVCPRITFEMLLISRWKQSLQQIVLELVVTICSRIHHPYSLHKLVSKSPGAVESFGVVQQGHDFVNFAVVVVFLKSTFQKLAVLESLDYPADYSI